MKKLLITAAALTLLGAPAAFAQQQTTDQNGQHDQHDHKGTAGQGGQGAHSPGGTQGAQGSQGAHSGAAPAGSGPPHVSTPSNAVPNSTPTGNGGRQWNGVPAGRVGEFQTSQGQGQAQGHGSQPGGRPDWDAYYRDNPDLQRAYRQNQQSPTYHESIDAFAARHYAEHGKAEGRQLPTLQGGGQGQDRFRNYQRNTTAQRRFRLPEYRWPQGSSYRRYSFGQFLPRMFFGQNYWLYDYSDYGLPYPPPGAAWVRYGPDALMIDQYSGEIIEVVYGAFY